MSHRWDCPDRYEAERRGERDFEWGRSLSNNPYKDVFHPDRGCEEAADSWRSGYRRAEMREEERREEEAARQRAAYRRAEADAEEAAYYERAEAEAQMQAEYEAAVVALYQAEMAEREREQNQE